MSRSARPRYYSFAQLLAGLLLLLLLASMSLIAVVSSYFTRRSVGELSERIVQQTLGRVDLRVGAVLDQAMNQNAQGKLLMVGRQLPFDNIQELGGYFAHSLEVLTELTYLGFGFEHNGDYVFAERTPDGKIRVREYVVDESGQRVIRDWRWQGAQREKVQVTPWDGYDPRKRPFYQSAVRAHAPVWTETYQFWQGSERGAVPGVTFATPYYDADDHLLGVLNSDFDLAALCRFLAEVRRDMVGYAFVVERRAEGDMRLIAHPDPTVLPNSGDNALTNMTDRTAAAFVQAVLSDESKRENLLTGGTITFAESHKQYFASTRQLKPPHPPWIIAVIIPVDEVMSGVYRNDRRAFWIGLVCLAVTALLAIRLARRIGEPLRQLSRDAQAIRRLDLTGRTDAASRIREVAELASSVSEMKSSLRSFQKFVPVEVVRDIVTTASEARLGGQRATLTLFFSDIADFTAIAEGMSPEGLVEQIGEYLGHMSEVIHAGGGTIDKFIGDGIMAFWGAPRANPNHALEACRAALQCQKSLAQLRSHWQQAGKPELRARIGIHTGSVVVGNIGSESRLNYTAIGDAVNLTSRLEGLNKFYGTEVLVSDVCLELVGPAVVTRPVDQVSVKGRSGDLVVHELLAMAEEIDEATRQRAALTAQAFANYLSLEFGSAREKYEQLLAEDPQDSVAALMVERCVRMSAAPRAESWDTTFRMKDK